MSVFTQHILSLPGEEHKLFLHIGKGKARLTDSIRTDTISANKRDRERTDSMRRRIWPVLIVMLLMWSAAGSAEKKACSHVWESVSITSPTCTEEGKQILRCSLCGKKKTEKLPALGHIWDYCTIVQKASCTEEGRIRCYCSRDHSHYKDDVQPALGHAWGEWTTVYEAGLTMPGLQERTCGRCGAKETQQIPQMIRRKPYNLKLLVFPDATVTRGVTAEELTQAGDAGIPVEWVFAIANTGENNLRLRWEGNQESEELGAGEVCLLSQHRTIRAEDFSGDQTVFPFRLYGESSDGKRVCEPETISGRVLLLHAEPTGTCVLEITQQQAEEGKAYHPRDIIRYTVTVTNRGTETIPRVEIRDIPKDQPLILADLQPGETRTEIREYTVSRQDAIAGYICWVAEAKDTGTGAAAESAPLIVPIRAE